MIERCRDEFPIRLMCRCLRVSASGYYDWSKRLPGVLGSLYANPTAAAPVQESGPWQP